MTSVVRYNNKLLFQEIKRNIYWGWKYPCSFAEVNKIE